MNSLRSLPNIEKVSDKVIRVLGCNPGPFTLQGTNTYLVGTGSKRILVDTGEADNKEYLENLSNVLAENNIHLQEIILTHWHRDHVGGIPGVCKNVCKDSDLPISKFPRNDKRLEEIDDHLSYVYIEDLHKFSTEGATLRALYTPGHADDHICLYFEEENAIFTGDTVLGEGTSVFEDLHSYMESLNKILTFNPTRLYPAHGSIVEDPQSHLTMYINNRLLREKQIVNVLEQNSKCNIPEIVGDVYKGLEERLIKGAMNNVQHHLTKLIKDGRVDLIQEKEGQEFYRLKKNSCL